MPKHRKKNKVKLGYIRMGGNYTNTDLIRLSNMDGVAVVSEDAYCLSTIVFNKGMYPIRDIYELVLNTHGRLRILMRGSMRFKEFDKLHIN